MSCSEAIELDEDSLDAIEDCEPFAVAPEVSVLDLLALRARPARGPLKWVGGGRSLYSFTSSSAISIATISPPASARRPVQGGVDHHCAECVGWTDRGVVPEDLGCAPSSGIASQKLLISLMLGFLAHGN
jgi:hypothetical protein